MSEVTIDSRGPRRLAGRLEGDPAATHGVVVCHGMLSSMGSIKHTELAARLTALGFRVLRFDFATRGRSRALNPDDDHTRITYTDQTDDLAGAVDFFRSSAALERLYLVGSSMGGSVCLLYAAQQPVDAVVTFGSPAHPARPRPPHFPESLLEQWRSKGYHTIAGNRVSFAYVEDARRQDLLAAAAASACPKLLIHGADDEVVPLADGRELAAAGDSATLLEIAGADHRFSHPETREKLLSAAVAFLEKLRDNPIAQSGGLE